MNNNWLERTTLLLGEDKLNLLREANVLVVGLGGVGAYAAEMIARAGVGRMTIADADIVSETNINRQLIALHSTIGREKCEILAERLKDINPALDLIVIKEYLEAEKAGDVLGEYKIDFLVDAIDTLSPKLHLIKYCMDSGIPLVSSMGAGAKYDVTKVRIADVSKSFNCPLAYIVRKRLRYMGIKKGFKVVFSEELPDKESIVPCEDRNKKSQVGTISYIPAVFGCACAQAVVQGLMEMNNTQD
jgi:tRNA A37 threonylcarbamoyladenosine dehydratase